MEKWIEEATSPRTLVEPLNRGWARTPTVHRCEGERLELQVRVPLDCSVFACDGCPGSRCAKQTWGVLARRGIALEEEDQQMDHQELRGRLRVSCSV
jgi:hypothetical protein